MSPEKIPTSIYDTATQRKLAAQGQLVRGCATACQAAENALRRLAQRRRPLALASAAAAR